MAAAAASMKRLLPHRQEWLWQNNGGNDGGSGLLWCGQLADDDLGSAC